MRVPAFDRNLAGQAPWLIALASLGLLLGALGFQYIGDLAPCELCLKQRVPHALILAVGPAAGLLLRRDHGERAAAILLWLGALILLGGAGLALYHVGVEQHWWQGPDTCSAIDLGNDDFNRLAEQLMRLAVVSCDQVAWSLFGVSMAGYNFLASLGLAGFAAWAASTIGRENDR